MLRPFVATVLFGWSLTLTLPVSGQITTGAQVPGSQATAAQAVNKQEKNLHLTRVQTVTVPSVQASSFVAPFTCDREGNIYLQNDLLSPAIQKVQFQGRAGCVVPANPQHR